MGYFLRNLSYILFATGLCVVIVASPTLTGAFVGVIEPVLSSVIGYALMIISGIIFTFSKNIERKEKYKNLDELINQQNINLFTSWLYHKHNQSVSMSESKRIYATAQKVYDTSQDVDHNIRPNHTWYLSVLEKYLDSLPLEDITVESLSSYEKLQKEDDSKLNLAQLYLKQRHLPESPKDYENLAKKMGYTIETSKEGTKIRNSKGKVITELPKRIKNKGIKIGILKALSSGESSWRRNNQKNDAA